MIYMAQVPLRFEDELLKKIDELARKKYETRSDFVREAVIEKINSEEERSKVKDTILSKFAEGDISYKILRQFLGKEEADKYRIVLRIFSNRDRANKIIRQLRR